MKRIAVVSSLVVMACLSLCSLSAGTLPEGAIGVIYSENSVCINSVAFSPDGKLIAGGISNGSIVTWDTSTYEIVSLYFYGDIVNSVAFSPDGRLIAGGGQMNVARVWDTSIDRIGATATLSHDDYVNSVAFSPDGRLLASGDEDSLVKLWDVSTFQEVKTLSHSWDGWVTSVAFSPDGRLLASGDEDNVVKLWDLSTFQEVRTLTGHSDYVTSVAFSPDGRLLASGSDDETVKLWDISTFQEVVTLTGHDDYVTSVAFSPDGKLLACGDEDSLVKLWDVATFQEVKTFTGHDGDVTSVAFSPDGRTLASGSEDETILLWAVPSSWVPDEGTPTEGDTPESTPAELVAYWNFDEGQGTVVHDIAGNNDGMINGNPVWVDGYFGGGLEFDGTTNYVDCGADASLKITETLTIAAWIKADNLQNWDGIVVKGVDSFSFAMQVWGDGALRFSSNWGILTGAIGSYSFNSNTKMPEGEWVHTAVTYDGDTLRFYINGTLDSLEANQAITFGTSTEPLILGCDFPGGDEYFDGVIDEVRIYNQALTGSEVQQIMVGTAPSQPDQPPDDTPGDSTSDLSGLVLHLPFNEGSGITANDTSGYGNHGELRGNVTWVTGVNGTAVHISDDSADNLVLVRDDSTLDITDEITMAMWVSVKKMNYPWGSLLTKGETYMLHTNPTTSDVTIDPLVFIGSDVGIWPSEAGVQIPFDEWHHVVGIYDGQEKSTYIDGVLQGSHPRSGQIRVNDFDLVIGRDNRPCCSNRRDELTIDDVMVFNRAISEAEIQAIMAGTTPPSQPGDVTAPVITSGPSAGNITSTSAVITWSTNEASSSVVEYGQTSGYGLTASGMGSATNHSVSLSSLSPSTSYYYRVVSTDSSGNTARSAGGTFTTGAESTSGEFVLMGTDPDDAPYANIDQVFVSSDGEKISFRITTHRPWDRYVDFYIDIDWDQNPYTGYPEDGTDCSIQVCMADGNLTGGFWIYDPSISNYNSTSVTLFDVLCVPNSDTFEASIQLSELGNPDAIDFLVWMLVMDLGDFAPKEGLYTYVIEGASDLPSTPTRTLSMTSGEASPVSSTTVYLSITDAADIAGGDVEITYDPSIVTVGDVSSANLLSTMPGMNLVVNTNMPGKITIGIAGTAGIASGSGALVNIQLIIGSSAQSGTQTVLAISSAEMYSESGANIPVNSQNGVVQITQGVVIGDVNADGKVRSNDAILTLRIATGLMTPTSAELWAADKNGDGRVRSNDAILILREAAGLTAPVKGVIAGAAGRVAVSLAEAHGVAGESITVPVKVDNSAGLAGGDISITYDSTVLRAVDVSCDSDVMLASNVSTPGVVSIAFASTDGLSRETLAHIRFDILADAVSPLSFQQVELYSPDALPLNSVCANMEFRSWAVPPDHSALLQNFPNPFNPETWIPYQLSDDQDVAIRIYSAGGEVIRELALGHKSAGLYVSRDRSAYWDGRNASGEKVASGVYFYSIQAGDFIAVRKLSLLK